MAFQAGQTRIPYVDLSDHDGTTEAAVEIITDAATSAPITSTGVADRYTANESYVLTAGEIIERWTVTGTGETTIDNVIYVGPQANAVLTGTRVYATTADYAEHITGAPPAGIRGILVTASRLVDEMLLTAFYDTDDDDMPTDAAVIAAMRDATCMQAEFAIDEGKKRMTGAAKASGFSIGGLSVQKPGAAPASGSKGMGPNGEWAPRAWARLKQARLTGHEPWS